MWNATKKKREQQRMDDMVTKVGMPPGWTAIGRDKKGWVYRWCKGDSYVEHYDKRWYWYTVIKTKHAKANGAFTCPVACAVACELTMGDELLEFLDPVSCAVAQELPRVRRY